MMRKVLLYFLFLNFSFNYPIAGESTIRIVNTDSLSESIIFYKLNYPFFDLRNEVGIIYSPEDLLKIEIDNTSAIFFDYGPYQCYFFMEPGKNYDILLPDISELDEGWIRNPFFKKEVFHVELSKEDNLQILDINEAIRNFDREYKPFIDRQILRYYYPDLAKVKRDSFIQANFQDVDVSDKNFYKQYIYCKKAILEFSNQNHDLHALINNYLIGQKVNIHNPAYREMFELLLQDYYHFKSQNEEFLELSTVFSKLSLPSLQETIKKDPLLANDTIAFYVFSNEIYKAYYSGFYDKKSVLEFLTLIELNTELNEYVLLTEFLKKKFTLMEPGYKVPAFNRKSIQGDSISIEKLKGKYIYLGFLDISNFQSLQEIEYLKYLHSQHNKYIHIVSFIIMAENRDLKDFAEYNSINWQLIPVKRKDELLVDFKVRAIPIFYLIDKDGCLLSNPAAAPSENFENQLFELLKFRNELVR